MTSIGSRRAICSKDDEKYLDKISSCDSFTHRRETFQIKDLNGRATMGYVYAAWCPLFPKVVKIGAYWDPEFLNFREISAECRNTFMTNGEFKVSIILDRLSKEAHLPHKFELIAGFATMSPYRSKQIAHEYFRKFRAPTPWIEFFGIQKTTIVSYFRNVSSKYNLPFFSQYMSLPLPTTQAILASPKTNAWTVPLYSKTSSSSPQPAHCSNKMDRAAVVGRLLGAWAVPLIPKIVAATAPQHISLSPTSGGEGQAQMSESDYCDVDSREGDDTTTAETSDFTTKTKRKRSKNKKTCGDGGDWVLDGDSVTQGLFVAEMSNGVHVSMGRCWATTHYNTLDPDSPPVCVVHMCVPMRLP
jgi:hypothetical protein